MKTLVLIVFFGIAQCITCVAQSITYHLPEKRLRITVVYKLTGYALRLAEDDKVVDSKYEMVITDPVKVEEVVVPDLNRRFDVQLPERLASAGARFEWMVQLDRNGILTGWNASREPIVTQILAGGVGFVANILTGLTPSEGILPAAEEKIYKVDTEQKFTVTETIDVPVSGLDHATVAAPTTKVSLKSVPSVTVTLIPVSTGTPSSEAVGRTDALYHIEPRPYRLLVDVNNNGLIQSTRVIDEIIRIPQHGALRQISLTELFKGRKAATLSLDPATGQLLSWEYKRAGSTRTETTDLSKQLTALAEAVAAARAANDRRLEQEVTRLSLEVEKLELQERLGGMRK
jgi:hypothetical protein